MRATIALLGALALTACGDSSDPTAVDLEGTTAPTSIPDDSNTPAQKAVAEATTQPVACQTGEATLFSCKVAGGKTIAVCGKDGNAQYRFGGATPELTLDKGKFASVPYSGGGEAQIAFSNGDTRYVVFSRTVRTNFEPGEPNNPEFTDGVIVTKGDNIVGEQLCTGEPESVDVMAGENYGGVADELFYGA